MIRSFRDDVTKAVYRGECPKGFPSNILKVVRRKLAMVDAAKDLSDLRVPPNNKLHPLHGDREGQYAIRINDQYRICFEWRDGDSYDVEIIDYH